MKKKKYLTKLYDRMEFRHKEKNNFKIIIKYMTKIKMICC